MEVGSDNITSSREQQKSHANAKANECNPKRIREGRECDEFTLP